MHRHAVHPRIHIKTPTYYYPSKALDFAKFVITTVLSKGNDFHMFEYLN